MELIWTQIVEYLTVDMVLAAVRGLMLVGAGLVLAKLAGKGAAKLAERTLDKQRTVLARRGAYYAVLALFTLSALHQLGFNLSLLMGAAGVVTVGVGFASQTSASNLVSGLFLILEQPFRIGDVIEVGGTTGEVLSIDPLAVKLRTFDNQFVRVPNETLIKSEVRTLTKFPIRRADLQIGVAYKEDLDRVREILLTVAERNPVCLEEPNPMFLVRGFGDSSIDLQFSVWSRREKLLELRNSMQFEIKQAFDEAGVEIPFPHRSLHACSDSQPLPIRVVSSEESRSVAV